MRFTLQSTCCSLCFMAHNKGGCMLSWLEKVLHSKQMIARKHAIQPVLEPKLSTLISSCRSSIPFGGTAISHRWLSYKHSFLASRPEWQEAWTWTRQGGRVLWCEGWERANVSQNVSHLPFTEAGAFRSVLCPSLGRAWRTNKVWSTTLFNPALSNRKSLKTEPIIVDWDAAEAPQEQVQMQKSKIGAFPLAFATAQLGNVSTLDSETFKTGKLKSISLLSSCDFHQTGGRVKAFWRNVVSNLVSSYLSGTWRWI